MTTSREVKIGIIGTSRRGQYLSSLYHTIDGCRITAICDRYEHLVQQAWTQLGDNAIARYTDHHAMLREADIDAVMIIVQPEHAADLIVEALEAGKHVMSEVPLAYSLEDCWRIVLAVEKSGLKFQLAEQMRYAPFIQAWRQMVQDDRLGKVLFVEGEYLHGMTDERYWVDSETGVMLDYHDAANNPKAIKSRFWNLTHPIYYLPHELSPILSLINDRVVKVSCMSTRRPSYYHEWFPNPDIEVALMHTENDVILRLAAGFTMPTLHKNVTGGHWYHVMGTKGSVETHRSNAERMKMWLPFEMMNEPAEVAWEHTAQTAPPAAISSGHGGNDYYPMATFVASILDDAVPPLDVYTAVETAAPAIVAALSAEQGGACLEVPDFRPNAARKAGETL